MNKLTESQIEILANYYVGSFDAWEAWEDLYDALERPSIGEKYYIYRALCKNVGTIFEIQNNKLICEMDRKENYSLFNKISRSLYIKLSKINKIGAPLNSEYDNKIVIKFIVYK